MKRIIIALVCIFFMTGCTGGTETPQTDTSVVPKLGDTVILKNFEVTLVGYTIGKSLTTDKENLVYLDVKIKNKAQTQLKFERGYYNIYNQNSVLINPIVNVKYTTSVSNLSSIRPNGTANAQIIFKYSGPGVYYIEFAGINGRITAEIDITQ